MSLSSDRRTWPPCVPVKQAFDPLGLCNPQKVLPD